MMTESFVLFQGENSHGSNNDYVNDGTPSIQGGRCGYHACVNNANQISYESIIMSRSGSQ